MPLGRVKFSASTYFTLSAEAGVHRHTAKTEKSSVSAQKMLIDFFITLTSKKFLSTK